MINVLHLIDTDKACGPGRTVLESARSLHNTEYKLTIAAFNFNGKRVNPYLDEVKSCGLAQVLIPTRHQLDPAAVMLLKRTIKEIRADILHTHGYKSDLFGLIAARGSNVKLVSTAHGWIQNCTKAKIYVSMDKFILRYYHRVIAVSEKIKEDLIKSGVSNNKIVKIHNAIDTHKYSQASGRPVLRQEYGISDNCKIIGTIGRLSLEKGQKVLLNAAKIILDKNPDCIFAIIGEGYDLTELRKHSEMLGIDQNVIFTGHRKDMIDIYHDLDIVVIPSFTEGLPNVGLEALAMKKPLVATNVGGVPEIIDDMNTGFLVRPGNAKEIADAVIWIILNPVKVHRIVENGRVSIEQNYSFEQRIQRVTEIYSELFCSENK